MDLTTQNSVSRWFALTVKPQHERTAACALEAKGLEEFVPLYRDRRQWSDRVKELELPLFSGYVFCRFAPRERGAVLATPGVRSIVSFGNTPAPVAESEIQSIRAMIASGLPVGPWPYLQVGQAVQIDRGALRGLDGLLLQLKDGWRVVVSVPLLQRSVAVEIDREAISLVTQSGERHAAQSSRGFARPAKLHSSTAA